LKCSKSKKRKRTEKWVCRAGAGEEETAGVSDTPGFVLWSEPVIVSDPHGYNQIELSRNNKCVVQSSLDLCQSLRGNCDFQILLYECDPFSPDPHLRLQGSQTMLLPLLVKETAYWLKRKDKSSHLYSGKSVCCNDSMYTKIVDNKLNYQSLK
jgi:hypothetical protein